MERLSRRTLRDHLDVLRDVYVTQNLDAFSANILRVLPKVVPSEVTVYNEVNPPKQQIRWIEESVVTGKASAMRQAFERHMFEHPILAHRFRTRDGSTLKISDFLTRRQWHRLGLHNDFFRRLGLEREMVVAVPTPPPRLIWIALHRSRADFTERDRLYLNLLRPHLTQAYRNAEMVTELEREVALVTRGVEALGGGVIILTRAGRVHAMSVQARRRLGEYFGRSARETADLPAALRDWIGHQKALLRGADNAPPPRAPLVVEGEGKRLIVRLLSEPGRSLLLLEERLTGLQPSFLEPLGLSRRETQVLAWVAEGKTNEAVARVLGVAPLTVKKHLEHIYQKLNVETRMAAVARARQAVS